MDDLGWAYRWGVPILVATLVAWFVVDCAQGQSFGAEGEGGMMAWASDSHSYQHAMHSRVCLTATWGPVVARAKLSLKRWGASDAILRHAMLNAETAKVYSRRQGGSAGIRWKWVEFGLEYDRRSVHHVWRHKSREPRHAHFPGSWEIGRSGDAPDWGQTPIFPSLGYWELLRGYVRARPGPAEITLRLPGWRWKTLTLPWPALRLHARYEWQSWWASVDLQGLRHRSWTGSLRLARHLTGPLWTQAKAGWAHPPQWRDQRLFRLSFGVFVQTTR